MYFPIHVNELYSFIVIVMLMIMSPGVNQVLVLQSGLSLGHKAAIYNVAGIASSMFIHMLLSGLGISLIIVNSPSLFSLIKTLGCGYLIYLALTSIFAAYRLYHQPADVSPSANQSNIPAETIRQSFAKGFTTNVLNIQTSFIFLSIFPQYMNLDHGLLSQSLFLTLIFVGLLIAWYSLVVAMIFRIRHHLLEPKTQSRIKALTGFLLLVMAVQMLLK